MYLPSHFALEDLSSAFDIIEERHVGTLVVESDSSFEANLLPWSLSRGVLGEAVLRGHVGKANPLTTLVQGEIPALVIFDLVDGYISPNWYPSKKLNQRVVPTWNYISVHAHGRAQLIHDSTWLAKLVTRLTDINESDQELSWQVSDAPDDFIAKQLQGIVGIEVVIERLDAKAKLSQNRASEDAAGAASGLGANDREQLLSAKMREVNE